MLLSAENVSMQSLQILYIFVLRPEGCNLSIYILQPVRQKYTKFAFCCMAIFSVTTAQHLQLSFAVILSFSMLW